MFHDAPSEASLTQARLLRDCDAHHFNEQVSRSRGQVFAQDGSVAAQTLALRAVRQWGLRRVPTFHHLKDRAPGFAAALAEATRAVDDDQWPAGKVWATHIVAETSATQRRVVLHRLGRRDDAPGHWRAAWRRQPRASMSQPSTRSRREEVDDRIIQAVGRALRTDREEGKVGTMVVPVFLPAEGGKSAAVAASASPGRSRGAGFDTCAARTARG